MNRLKVLTVTAAGALLLVVPNARAVVMTYQFSGHIDNVYDPNHEWTGLVAPWDTFSGSYVFDSATPDLAPSDPSFGNYVPADSLFSITIGSWTGTSAAGHIGVFDTSGADELSFGPYGFDSSGKSIVELSMTVLGPWGFTSDAVPASAPPLGDFPFRHFGLQDAQDVIMVGTVDSLAITPEPVSILLLMTGAALMLLSRRSPH